jgi:hypothetical protein
MPQLSEIGTKYLAMCESFPFASYESQVRSEVRHIQIYGLQIDFSKKMVASVSLLFVK